jgi:anti-anti-sigma regulatory factor
MAIPLRIGIQRDDDMVTLSLAGELDLPQVPRVRAALLNALAELPVAVLVDVSQLIVDSDLPLAVFASAGRRAAQWPAVPLLLYGATDDLAARVASHRFLSAHADRARALAALGQAAAVRRVVRADLPFDASSLHLARHMVTEACLDWGLDERCWEAELIVSELATNALRFARPPLRVALVLNGDYLHLSVRDGSRRLPAPGPGTDSRLPGLGLVDALATGRGATCLADGKSIWAVLRVHRATRSVSRGLRTGDWVRR